MIHSVLFQPPRNPVKKGLLIPGFLFSDETLIFEEALIKWSPSHSQCIGQLTKIKVSDYIFCSLSFSLPCLKVFLISKPTMIMKDLSRITKQQCILWV